MLIRIEAEVDIARPPAEVFAVVTDVAHHPDWSTAVVRVIDLSDAGVTPGTTWIQFNRILGREFEVHAKVIGYVPDRRFEFSVDKPAHVEMLWRLQPRPQGTHVIVTAKGDAGLSSALVLPMRGSLRAALADDLDRLKKRLEGGSD